MDRSNLNLLLSEYNYAERSAREEEIRYEEAKKDNEAAHDAQTLVQNLAEQIQTEAHKQLASVVSSSLEAVFENPYTFHIDFEKKRGRTEARLIFKQGDLVLTEPTFSSGGGNIDIAALALRLSCLMLARPKKRRLLVLDEPFKAINGTSNRERAAALITQLAKKTNTQIIISTGLEWLRKCGTKVINLDEE